MPLDVLVDGTTAQLTAIDFSVTQAGQPLTIAAIRLVVPTGATAPLPAIASDVDETEAAGQADRLIGIYIDEYHLSPGRTFEEAKSSLATFVRTELGPRDLVVVVKPLASLRSIRLSADRDSAARIIEQASARQGDYRPQSTFEAEYFAADPARIEASRSQIVLSSLAALTMHLGRFSNGRKTLIVLSDGLVTRPRSRAEAVLPGEETIARSANRARVAMYMIRPEKAVGPELPQGESTPRREPLSAIAERTTGLVLDAGASASGLRQVLGETSRYYLLDVVPPQAPDDQYHTVAVTSRQPGVRVRARSGYALFKSLPAAPDENSPGRMLARVPRQTSRLIRVWFGQSAADDGRTRVVFVWEPAPPVPGARSTGPGMARVSLTVSGADGEPVFAGEALASGRAVVVDATAADRMQASFDTVPGTLLSQIEVLDAAGRVLDKDVRDLVVRRFSAPGSLGTAAVYRARSAVDLRSLRDDTAAAPVASRQFSRAESLLIRTALPGPADGSVVSAKLMSSFGSPLRSLDVSALAQSNDIVRQVEVPLAALASGQYAVEFTATSPAGTNVERVSFSVTP